MGTVVLVSCAKRKACAKTKARDMYQSLLFRLQLKYAESLRPNYIFILSAKYGLLDLNDVIEPYDVTLNTLNDVSRKDWSRKVIEDLKQRTDLDKDVFIILAGAKYREYLTPLIKNFTVPMENMSIGHQLHFLKERLHEH